MQINAHRLRTHLEALAQIGREPGGGITRTAFSPAYLEAAGWLVERMKAAGLAVTFDPASNVVGRLPGEQTGGMIGIGSHLDTVPNGGRFDGALGVLAALEVAQTIRESGLPLRRHLEVIAFADEEGSRFGAGLFGSRSFAGRLDADLYRKLTDAEGQGLPEAMAAVGFDFAQLPRARRDLSLFRAFLEVHIEQGPELEQAGCPIGIVTGMAGSRRFRLQIRGEANHGGTTAMHLRKDALVGASQIVLAVREQVLAAGGYQLGTVGHLSVVPGIANVIPGEATLVFEVRDVDAALLDASSEGILDRARAICASHGLELQPAPLMQRPPVMMDRALQDQIRRVCERLGVACRPMVSRAGHDCMVFVPQVPIAMIFVPSRGGYSHSPKEHTDWEHVFTGAQVFLHTVLGLLAE